MGRRYYCEYCDKSFIDELEARRKHLNSAHHIKLRQLHYEQHKDSRKILEQESIKMPCRRFLQGGECQFGVHCKYTHYTSNDLADLKRQVALHDYNKLQKHKDVPEIPSLESWLENYNKKHNKIIKDDNLHLLWTYPDHLECRNDLPPSLRRLKPDDFVHSNFAEWGV